MTLFNIIITLFLLTACTNSNSKATGESQTDNTTSAEKTDVASSTSMQDEGLVGEWELVGSIVDTNDDLQIDENERKNLTKPSYKDYMKLNRDGSGLFTIAHLEGRYEIKKESNGRNVMTWYDRANGPHRVGSIMKVTKDELTIKEPGGNGLFLWKRL